MGKPAICRAFRMSDPHAAYEHIHSNWETVEDYGDRAYGHSLHVWDDGYRVLGRCRECGAYILAQFSEFHSISGDDDDYFSDHFPVADPAEADMLNREFDGFSIETDSRRRYLRETNFRSSWSSPPEP